MHDRATGALDGTFLYLIKFQEHKDTTEVVGLLKQYLGRHKWAFKQNTAFKKLSNKKIERATFQVLGPLSRREESKDGTPDKRSRSFREASFFLVPQLTHLFARAQSIASVFTLQNTPNTVTNGYSNFAAVRATSTQSRPKFYQSVFLRRFEIVLLLCRSFRRQ